MNKAKKLILPAVVAAAGFGGVGGATLISNLSASAATPAATSTSSTTASADTTPASMPAHGSASHESTETAVTGDNATKAQAAAVKSLGGGTAGAVVTDYQKSGYEVTVTKSDGTSTEVHLDSSFAVEDHGKGNN